MKRLNLDFGKRSYDIVIENSFDALAQEMSMVCRGRVLLVTDTNVAPVFADEVSAALEEADVDVCGVYSFKAGEKSKNIDTLQDIYNACVKYGLDRNASIAALGGGVCGDMAGLAAATYMRGIGFVQIPTTLLAQTDSSVGGKVGIDFAGIKNIVGAFKQPRLVYINTKTLKTLPQREFSAGMAEIIKYGIIRDSKFFDFLDKNSEKIKALDENMLEDMIYRCCEIKADVVMNDETERGVRAILNFGHTIGHGVESAKEFELLHGECVAIGMSGALEISRMRGYMDADSIEACNALIKKYNLSTSVSGADESDIIGCMKNDKKKLDGRLRFVLAQKIGSVEIFDDVGDDEISNAVSCIVKP